MPRNMPRNASRNNSRNSPRSTPRSASRTKKTKSTGQTPAAKTSIDNIAESHVGELIDSYINTLYANDVSGYGFGEHSTLRAQVVKTINEKLESVNAQKRKALKKGFEYDLMEFDKFHNLPQEKRQEIIALAREKQLLPKDAYESAKTDE